MKTVKMQLPPHEVHDEVHEFDKEQQWLAKQRKCMIVLRNDHTHRSLNSFNEHFAVFFDLQFFGSHVAHGQPAQKHVPCLLMVIHTCQSKGN